MVQLTKLKLHNFNNVEIAKREQNLLRSDGLFSMKNFSLIFLLLLLVGCSKAKSSAEVSNSDSGSVELPDDSGILVVDVNKEYPKSKPVYIQDIADVEYIPLETNNDFLCTTRNVTYMDDSLIIYTNQREGDILIFNRIGKAQKRINRKGQSGEEYIGISNLIFDKNANELYINDMWKKKIFVYDINGKYKRSFWHLKETQYSCMYNFSEQALLCYNGSSEVFDKEKYPFKIISKQTGEKIKDIEIPFEKRIDLIYKFRHENGGLMILRAHSVEPAIRIAENSFILNEVSSDTIYKLSEDFSITPFMVQMPSLQNMGENPHYLAFVMGTTNYQFIFTQKKVFNEKVQSGEGFPTTYLMYDKKKKEILEQNFYNRDIASESFEFESGGNDNQAVYGYRAHKLKEYLEQGKLSGKLKEIAAKLDAEDNPVLMVMTFKK